MLFGNPNYFIQLINIILMYFVKTKLFFVAPKQNKKNEEIYILYLYSAYDSKYRRPKNGIYLFLIFFIAASYANEDWTVKDTDFDYVFVRVFFHVCAFSCLVVYVCVVFCNIRIW